METRGRNTVGPQKKTRSRNLKKCQNSLFFIPIFLQICHILLSLHSVELGFVGSAA